jgi:hypothetical protein
MGHLREGTVLPVEATGTHPYSPPYSVQEATVLGLDFPDQRLALWRELDFQVNPGGYGDYVRSIGAEIVGDENIDKVSLDLTNSSVYELGAFSYSISGKLSLVDLGRGSRLYLRSREGEAEIGSWVP